MAITIDGDTYTEIIGTEFSEVSRVQLPEWINDAIPDIKTGFWNKSPLRITYMIRITDAQKWALDQNLIGHTTVTLVDGDYDIDNTVWVRKVDVTYARRRNDTKRWLMTVELIYA